MKLTHVSLLAVGGLLTGAAFFIPFTPAEAQEKPRQSRLEALRLDLPPSQPGSVAGVRLIPPIGHTGDVQDVGISRDGRVIATCATDGTARVWEQQSGREVRAFQADDRLVYGVAIAPEGETVYVCTPKSLTAWSVADGRQRWRKEQASGYDIALSPDGTRIAVSNDKGAGAFICDAQSGVILQTLVHPEATYCAAFSADSQRVLFGCKNGSAYLWTMEGQQEAIFPGDKTVSSVAISPNGAQIAVCHSDDALRVWDVATRREVRQIRTGGKSERVTNVAWSPDGKRLAASHLFYDANGVYLWDAQTGAQVGFQKLPEQNRVRELCFLPDGSGLVAAEDYGTTTFFSVAPFASIRSLVGQAQKIQSLAVSADGRSLFAGLYPDTRIANWKNWDGVGAVQVDLQSGRLVRRFGPMQWGARALTVTPDGARLISAGDKTAQALWDTHTARRLSAVDNYLGSDCGAISPDGKLLAFEDHRDDRDKGEQGGWGCVSLFDAQNGKRKRTLTHPQTAVTDSGVALGFSPDNRFVFLATARQRLRAWNIQTGALVQDGQTSEPGAEKFDAGSRDISGAVQPGTTRVAIGCKQPALYDALTGKEIRRFAGQDITCYAFSGDGKRLAGGSRTGVFLWDTETGATLKQWSTPGKIETIALSPDGKRVFYAGADTVLRIADADTGQEVLSYLVLSGGDWLALSPSGRFEGSPGGVNRVSFESGGKTFDVSQFSEQFYQAGLVASALGGRTDDEADVPKPPAPIAQVVASPPPTVRLLVPSSATTPTIEVTVEATEQAKGGVKAIRLYQNGRLIGGPSALRGIGIEAVAGATTAKKFTVALESGTNELKAVAYSNTDLESKPANATVEFAFAAVAKPTLHVFTVGINTYKDASMNLAYARPDAEAIANVFDTKKGGKAGGMLFSNVTVSCLLDTEATGAAILNGIASLAQSAKPEDVAFLYLAGHGETANGIWYFLPTEMRQMALTERVQEFGIPWPKIEAAIGKIPARKVVLILDACKSGAVVGGVRGGVAEQQALAIMARAQGIHILTAANGQQYAGEVKALGHGILTYAILEGLSGKAGNSNEAAVMVSELMAYVDQRVPELALKYRGEEQYPTPLARGQNFPVAAKQ